MVTDVMHTVASSLQIPVIVLLLLMALFMVIMLGMLVGEFFTERRYFKLDVPKLVDDLHDSSDPAAVIRQSGMLRRQKNALFELLKHPEASAADRESMAVNIVAEEEAIFENRVKITDFISKVAPMLGLMGTLIPLGPGVIAIGSGDTQLLSESLLIAFDTTIIGLIVAALALLASTIRKSWYAKYSAAFEAACEIVLQKANEGAVYKAAPQPTPTAAPVAPVAAVPVEMPAVAAAQTLEMPAVEIAPQTSEAATPVEGITLPVDGAPPVDATQPLDEVNHA